MKLFVAGLPYDLDDAELEEIFEKFGTIASAKVAIDKETGKSRGFGFVDMPDRTEAKDAMDSLNVAHHQIVVAAEVMAVVIAVAVAAVTVAVAAETAVEVDMTEVTTIPVTGTVINCCFSANKIINKF
jgi:RNA recognition motif-containing protein